MTFKTKQLLRQAETLKAKLQSGPLDLLRASLDWSNQKELQVIYHDLLVEDLEYALNKKVEQDLWNVCFKNFITALQGQSKNKSNPQRNESQTLLCSFLEVASGSYLCLLEDICWAYDLSLPSKRNGLVFPRAYRYYTDGKVVPPKSSCLYIIQYCLVHLGDLARYRSQRKQAEKFYKSAIFVSPHCGHPYNQLALLEATLGDKFSTVFQYIRSIAIKNPFPVAITNLSNILSTAIDSAEDLTKVQTKMSLNEFMTLFLKAHGLLYTDTNLEQAELCVKSITSTLTALVATQSFTTEKLIKMTIINLYALKHTVGDNTMKIDDLTTDEKIVRGLKLDLLAGSLSAFLLPVYTLKTDDSFLDYYALPAIKLIFMWIKNEPSVLTDDVFNNRMQIWPSFCKLINTLQPYIMNKDYAKYSKTPLSYDRDLQGFLPLHETFKIYDYALPSVGYNLEKHIRAYRLLEFAKWLTNYDVNGKKLITCIGQENNIILDFQPGCTQPDPTVKLLEEMEFFKSSEDSKLKCVEKKGGILKPQGSLEKSREERVQVKMQNNESNSSECNKTKVEGKAYKRISQNVALQSIYKKLEENKQVKFSEETNNKEKEKTSPKAKAVTQRQVTNPTSQSSTYQVYNPSSVEKSDYVPFPAPPSHPNIDRNLPIFNNQPFNHLTLPTPNLYNTNFNSVMDKPMTFNVPPPPIFNYNKEERQPNSSWWPNHLPPNPMAHNNIGSTNLLGPVNSGPSSVIQSNNLLGANIGSNNIPNNIGMMGVNKMGVNPNYQHPDYFKFNQPNNTNEMFNSSWNGMNRNNNHNVYPSHNNQTLNIRQAMLNETNHHGGNSTAASNNVMNNAPGYSLFNTTSWMPSLPGQIRNNSNNEIRQQSLFSGPGPQSLQQLLDQQKKLQKGDS